MTLAVILLCLVLLLLTGLPIFAGLGLASIALLLIVDGQIGSLADIVYAKLNVYLLVAIPMFAFMAHVMIRSKVVDDLYATAHIMVRHLPGGLGVATVLSCTVFAAISGSSVATALTIGATAIPQMTRYGYRPRNIYGVVAAGGTLGILIPPSGPMILYGIVSETSIGALFFAGLIPGLILAAIFAAYAMWASGHGEASTMQDRATLREVGGAVKRSLAALSLPPLVLGGLYFGVFTPTEAAAVAAVYAFFIANFVYKDMGPLKGDGEHRHSLLSRPQSLITVFVHPDTKRTLFEAGRTTIMLLFIIANALILKHVLTDEQIPQAIAGAMLNAGFGPVMFLVIVNVILLIGGQFMEPSGLIVIVAPLVFPIAISLGIDPIHLGIVMVVNMEIGMITPPVGLNLFVTSGVAGMPMMRVVRAALPWLGILFLFLIMVTYIPWLSTVIPTALMGPEIITK